MIDVSKLEMTADKSRYLVDRDELEALVGRLEAAERELRLISDNGYFGYDGKKICSHFYRRLNELRQAEEAL